MVEQARLGTALRRIRSERNLTISEVARRTGLAISTLSKVESGKMSLTYDKLAQLTSGLEIDIADLFSANTAMQPATMVTGRRSINRAGDGVAISTGQYDHRYLSTEVSGKRMSPIIVDINARDASDFPDFVRHDGEEFVYVLEGELVVHTEFYAPIVLRSGESIWIDSQMGHFYLAHGNAPCRALAVCSGAEANLQEVFPPQQKRQTSADSAASKRGRKVARVS